VVAPGWVDYEC